MLILPFAKPVISCYQHHAVAQSIILGNATGDGYMPWFCDNYIQLKYVKDESNELSVDFVSPYIDLEYPMLLTQTLTRTFVSGCTSNIIEFIVENLKNDRYIYLPINTAYISAYEKTKIYHPILVYGYDDKHNSFFCADYFGLKYASVEIPYSEFKNAYTKYDEGVYWWDGLKLFEYNKLAEMKLAYDHDNVITLFNNYLNSQNISGAYRLDKNYKRIKYNYGISIYDRIVKELINQKAGDNYDIRVFSVLTDHKVALKQIIQYGKFYSDQFDLVKSANCIYEKCRMLKNMMIKYSVSKSMRILTRCAIYVQEIKKDEIQLFRELLSST